MVRHLATLAAAVLLAACGGPSTPVPVSGTATDLASLAGEWSGEYSSRETGRSGSIVFKLTAGTDSAVGDVMMSPQGGGAHATPATPGVPGPAPESMRPPHVLSIRFVRVQGGRVSGRLDPYTEAECSCVLLTVFEGMVKGDTLSGTYTSRPQGAQMATQEQHGRWQVTRRRG